MCVHLSATSLRSNLHNTSHGGASSRAAAKNRPTTAYVDGGGGRWGKTFASETIYFTFKLRNVSTFSSFWQMQMPETLSSFATPSTFSTLLPLLPLHPLPRASLRLLLDLICHRDLPVVFTHVIYCPHSHKDVFIMRFSTLFLLPLPPPWRFSSQANRYQQFGIVWKLICK